MDIYTFAKKEFEKQYDSKMTILINEPVKVGAITKNQWVAKITDRPCRIAQKRVTNPAAGETAPQIA